MKGENKWYDEEKIDMLGPICEIYFMPWHKSGIREKCRELRMES